MVDLNELTVGAYLEQLASAAPTPGGGAAAGLTGAQAAALLAMAGNLSRGRKYAAVAEQLAEIVRFCAEARATLMVLTNADAEAFAALMEAYRLPRGSEEEKRVREAQIQERLQGAADAPLRIMKESVRLATPAALLATIGNPRLISDVAVALELIDAALVTARLNVLVNLKQVADRDFVERVHGEMAALLEQFREEKRACMLAVEQELPGAAR